MTTPNLKLYTIFHLNLAYSSIEEEQRPEVIRRCYWPLLKLVRDYSLPFGVEATGYTLEEINRLDPNWITELSRLVNKGICEFIGSGYSQIIGPLVPAEVNAANLRIGNRVYKELIGTCPRIALINEQAYSAGLIRHYLDAGYQAIVMEWDNPYRAHPEWNPDWRFLPQIACGQQGEELPLIWNNSIAFQKFQRYVHEDMDLDEYLHYLEGHCSQSLRVFPIYGNDVEVFDFRPNRYETEAPLQSGEWDRIEILLKALLADPRYRFVKPSDVLTFMYVEGAGNKLHLETAAQPIPVKKQGKYNVTRWAVTGRDDLGINTACWRIYEALKQTDAADEAWKELCYLWSSDFRTHITEKRWHAYLRRLNDFEETVGAAKTRTPSAYRAPYSSAISPEDLSVGLPSHIQVIRNRSFLTIETNKVKARLNLRRGLAIDALWFKDMSDTWLCGTLHHGYYDDINWGADYYSGHLILESPGHRRITDLEPVVGVVNEAENRIVNSVAGGADTATGFCSKSTTLYYDQINDAIRIQATIPLPCGNLLKCLCVQGAGENPYVGLEYQLDWSKSLIGSLRLGFITLNPDAFSDADLFYETHNGGDTLEYFPITQSINHGDAVSFLVSAKQAIGATTGVVKIGDKNKHICVSVDKTKSALPGMIQYQKIGNSYICRLCWSAKEMDETTKSVAEAKNPLRCVLQLSVLPANKAGLK